MKAAATLITSLLLTLPALAQNSITVFAGDIGSDKATVAEVDPTTGFATTRTVSRRHGVAGVALSHDWNASWSIRGSVGYEKETVLGTPSNETAKTVPADLTVEYHLMNGSRFRPYLLGGARYVGAPNITILAPAQAPLQPIALTRPENRLSAELGVGTDLMLTHNFGLHADWKRLLRKDDVVYDPLRRATFGVTWKF